jgi:uncharacterized membrane protein YkvA (DUF1232 family)
VEVDPPQLEWLGVALIAVALAYAALLGCLVLFGRSPAARALARLIPDVAVLMARLLADGRVQRRRKVAILAGMSYLAMPVDVVPDFIPVAGQLDDALVIALVLRYVVRAGGPDLLAELWPGPPESLRLVLRLAYGAGAEVTGPDRSPRASSPRRRRSRAARDAA